MAYVRPYVCIYDEWRVNVKTNVYRFEDELDKAMSCSPTKHRPISTPSILSLQSLAPLGAEPHTLCRRIKLSNKSLSEEAARVVAQELKLMEQVSVLLLFDVFLVGRVLRLSRMGGWVVSPSSPCPKTRRAWWRKN